MPEKDVVSELFAKCPHCQTLNPVDFNHIYPEYETEFEESYLESLDFWVDCCSQCASRFTGTLKKT